MKREVCMFVDERPKRGEASHRIIVGCVVVGRERWNALHIEARRIGAAGPRRRLDLLAALLDRLQGFALLAYADLPIELVPVGEVGEIDGTDDILRMKREDNVWSQAVLAAAAAVLAFLHTGSIESAEIDLYYDTKSLTMTHRDAYEKTLREALPEIARQDPETGAIQRSSTLTFRRVEQVPKRQGETEANQLQHGTSLAHHLCSQADDLIAGRKIPHIVVRNHTEALCSMVAKFMEDGSEGNSRAT